NLMLLMVRLSIESIVRSYFSVFYIGIPGFLNISTAPFMKIGSGYYFIESKILKTWNEAYKTCRNMDANLISVESKSKLNLLTKYLIEMKQFKLFWSSGIDILKQGKHIWLSTGQPVTSDLWLPGEPNNVGNNEHCDELEIHPEIGGLNDKSCASLNYFICEAPQPKTASFVVW
ncbi:hypothetical protein KR084_001938, partial [Drosophila pseudotakahashii]